MSYPGRFPGNRIGAASGRCPSPSAWRPPRRQPWEADRMRARGIGPAVHGGSLNRLPATLSVAALLALMACTPTAARPAPPAPPAVEAAAATAPAAAAPTAVPLESVLTLSSETSVNHSVYWFGAEAGLYRRQGLDVELRNLPPDAPAIV